MITDSRLLIARHQSSKVHIRGDHLLISNCIVQVDIPPWIKVSLRLELVVMGIKVARGLLDLLWLLTTGGLRLVLLDRVELMAGEVAREVVIRVLVEILRLCMVHSLG